MSQKPIMSKLLIRIQRCSMKEYVLRNFVKKKKKKKKKKDSGTGVSLWILWRRPFFIEHLWMRISGLEMLVFRKILRTYKIDDMQVCESCTLYLVLSGEFFIIYFFRTPVGQPLFLPLLFLLFLCRNCL